MDAKLEAYFKGVTLNGSRVTSDSNFSVSRNLVSAVLKDLGIAGAVSIPKPKLFEQTLLVLSLSSDDMLELSDGDPMFAALNAIA